MSADSETQNQILEQVLPVVVPQESRGEIAPLTIIRTETAFSKYPIHNLAKKGKINIEITEKGEKGEVKLKWEVSYSDRYGQARQLAYKVDTLLVNRKIDEAGRPLPKIIRLGGLKQIAREFDLGNNTAKVKKALHQNASLYITAKVTYKTAGGGERWLEFGSTRYSLVFTGETLPDGRKADAVYVVLNDPFREILNSAAVRPLDYDYLKQLGPASQRWYEVISRQMYAVLKHNLPYLKYRYSDYCIYSAQQRYLDYDHFKKQMYKVHLPHIKSGYLQKPIRYEETTDSAGKLDWFMFYIPGLKARAEYKAFTSKRPKAPRTAELETGEQNTTQDRKAPQRPLYAQPEPIEQDIQEQVVQAFTKLPTAGEGEQSGELQDRAEDLVKHFYLTFHNTAVENLKKKPQARLPLAQASRLIEQHGYDLAKYIIDYAAHEAPKTNFQIQAFGGVVQYEAKAVSDFERRQLLAQEAHKAKELAQAETEAELDQLRTEEQSREAAKAYLAQLPKEEYQILYDRTAAELKQSKFWQGRDNNELFEKTVRGLMIKRIIAQQIPASETGE